MMREALRPADRLAAPDLEERIGPCHRTGLGRVEDPEQHERDRLGPEAGRRDEPEHEPEADHFVPDHRAGIGEREVARGLGAGPPADERRDADHDPPLQGDRRAVAAARTRATPTACRRCPARPATDRCRSRARSHAAGCDEQEAHGSACGRRPRPADRAAARCSSIASASATEVAERCEAVRRGASCPEVVERPEAVGDGLAAGIDEPQAGRGLDAADAGHRDTAQRSRHDAPHRRPEAGALKTSS